MSAQTPETVWHHLAHAHKLLSRMDDPNAQEVRHALTNIAETLRIWNQRIVDVGVIAMNSASTGVAKATGSAKEPAHPTGDETKNPVSFGDCGSAS